MVVKIDVNDLETGFEELKDDPAMKRCLNGYFVTYESNMANARQYFDNSCKGLYQRKTQFIDSVIENHPLQKQSADECY